MIVFLIIWFYFLKFERLISYFQSEYKEVVVESGDIKVEVFCAMTNSNIKFIACCRTFVERASKLTDMITDEIQEAMSYKMLIKAFAQLSNISFYRIQELVKFLVNQAFSKIKDHKKLDLEDFIRTDILETIGGFFKLLINSFGKKLWKYLYELMVPLYVQMIIVLSPKYKKTEREALCKKVESEIELIHEVFEDYVTSTNIIERQQAILESLYEILSSDSTTKVVSSIVHLSVEMRSDFNDKCVKALLRLRSDLSKSEKKEVKYLLKQEKSNIVKLQKKNVGKLFYKTVMTEFRISQFVEKFRKRKRKKEMVMRKAMKEQKRRDVMDVDEGDLLAVEEAAVGMRGILRYVKKKVKKKQTVEAVVEKVKKYTFVAAYFSFLDDFLIWRDSMTSSEIKGRVLLLNVGEVGVGMTDHFYFVRILHKISIKLIFFGFFRENTNF